MNEYIKSTVKNVKEINQLKEESQRFHQRDGVGDGSVLPINELMGVCRWMGSHFYYWIDYNGVAFSTESPTELLEWGRKLSGVWG